MIHYKKSKVFVKVPQLRTKSDHLVSYVVKKIMSYIFTLILFTSIVLHLSNFR